MINAQMSLCFCNVLLEPSVPVSINQSINQSIDRSINQSNNQSSNQSINQFVHARFPLQAILFLCGEMINYMYALGACA